MQEIISYSKAKSAGLKTYFTGKPCKYGHIDLRQTSNGKCFECRRIKDFKKYHSSVENGRQKALKSYYKNRYKRILYMRDYYIKNIIKEKARNHKYIETHKFELKCKWREARIHNKDKIIANQGKRRAKKLGCQFHYTQHDVKELLEQQKDRCAYCHVKLNGVYHVDHIIPLSKGGENGKHNIQICCPTCNLRKHAKDPIDFAQELGLLI